ncbi:MAG: flagellar biosynthesis protein FliQ [Gammaproteobacteria bacterium]|nr:flagellar biosynthesis protein FliQ [Gammaproteobacteria bacterium]
MGADAVLSMGRGALELVILLVLVLLVPSLVVGVLVSLFQAATQINEMTLSFIPKLLITVLVMVLAGPWMITLVTDYTRRVMEAIPSLIG